MLKINTVVIGILFAVIAGLCHAHSDHSEFMEPFIEKDAVVRADWIVKNLVKEKKLDKSWGENLKSVATLKPVGENNVWQAVINNPKEGDVTKQTLYIYLDEVGNLLGLSYKEKN